MASSAEDTNASLSKYLKYKFIKFVCFSKRNKKKSGKRDSNPRPRPWQGRALPTELFPQQKINGEEEETRTPTTQLSLPPQSSASTNSATSPTLSHSEHPCPRQDSNLHVVKHTHLKRARLPIPPLGLRKSFTSCFGDIQHVERKTGLEPATPTLARSCSTN